MNHRGQETSRNSLSLGTTKLFYSRVIENMREKMKDYDFMRMNNLDEKITNSIIEEWQRKVKESGVYEVHSSQNIRERPLVMLPLGQSSEMFQRNHYGAMGRVEMRNFAFESQGSRERGSSFEKGSSEHSTEREAMIKRENNWEESVKREQVHYKDTIYKEKGYYNGSQGPTAGYGLNQAPQAQCMAQGVARQEPKRLESPFKDNKSSLKMQSLAGDSIHGNTRSENSILSSLKEDTLGSGSGFYSNEQKIGSILSKRSSNSILSPEASLAQSSVHSTGSSHSERQSKIKEKQLDKEESHRLALLMDSDMLAGFDDGDLDLKNPRDPEINEKASEISHQAQEAQRNKVGVLERPVLQDEIEKTLNEEEEELLREMEEEDEEVEKQLHSEEEKLKQLVNIKNQVIGYYVEGAVRKKDKFVMELTNCIATLEIGGSKKEYVMESVKGEFKWG